MSSAPALPSHSPAAGPATAQNEQPEHSSLPARNPRELRDSLSKMRHRSAIKIGEALLALGLIDSTQLARAREAQAADPAQPLGAILKQTGAADQEAIHAGLALQLGIPSVDLRCWPLDPATLAQLPAPLVRYLRAVPIHLEGNVVFVAMSDVLDHEVLDALRLNTAMSVQPVYASEAAIQSIIDKHYATELAHPVSDEDLERDTGLYSPDAHAATGGHLAASDNVIVRLADQIIAEAHRERASDIHIEPMPAQGKTLIRVRIDGRMFARRSIPWAYRDALVSRYKVMANLNVAEHRIPQDGKIVFHQSSGTPVEVRVAVLPTSGGVEDVVLRLLDTNSALPIAALGLCEKDQAKLSELIERPYGIFLVCGPTGSGKTTTLHAALHHLNDGSRKIWTVENPVEITQPGLRQLEVNPRAGLTFATALRAFLRADPDVIMVGEIRDEETAKTALEASLTGHLVMSTLHTNNAPESIVRLLEMGMNSFNFADSLLGVLAQRLVPTLCAKCKEPVVATDAMLSSLAHECDPGRDAAETERLIAAWRSDYGREGEVALYRAHGCTDCRGTGYKGRVGLFELMPATAEIKRSIIERASAAELFELAVREGMQTMRQDGVHKVLEGRTEAALVMAATQR